MPAAGQCVTERVDRRGRSRCKPISDAEHDTGCAKRQESIARRDGAEPDRARGIIAGAAGDYDIPSHAPALRVVRRERRADLAALDEAWHVMEIEPGGMQQQGRPAAQPDVDP